MRRNTLFPRTIAPELIMVGDNITTQIKGTDGITVERSGVVATISEHSTARHFLTKEGGMLGAYHPGFANVYAFTINMREYEHDTLELIDRELT